jgi:aspartate/methionine/tyrosine aminotransferase
VLVLATVIISTISTFDRSDIVMSPCATSEMSTGEGLAATLAKSVSITNPACVPAASSLPCLSARGQRHGKKVTPFWDVFDRIIGNAYCETTNPHGIVNMAISNNYLLEPELLAFFGANLHLQKTDLTYGTSLFGSHRLFATLCKHFNSITFAPVRAVEPHHLITGPGCGPLLDQLAEHLCESGDGVLIAAPYYNGYDADLKARGDVNCIPVFSESDDGTHASNFEGPSALRGFTEAKEEWQCANPSKTVRAAIVCNPHNPVGRCYDREALIEYGRFAEANDVHLIFDEIFALSTYKPSSTNGGKAQEPFHSALSIDWQTEAGCHPGRIHVIWSASKDFGVNGLRIGTLISQCNPDLLRAMKATAKLYMVSSPADALFCSLIEDERVYHDFIKTNAARMAQAYDIFVHWADHHTIEYTPCNAGHFILLNLHRFLPTHVDGKQLQNDAAREGALWTKLLENAVCMTPGSNYHHPTLGMFRLTFTLRRPALLEGLARIERALGLPAWPGSHAARMLPEQVMSSIDPVVKSKTIDQRTQACQTGQDLDEQEGADQAAREADAVRQDYVDAVRMVLKQGGGSEALLSCGMGMACSACC